MIIIVCRKCEQKLDNAIHGSHMVDGEERATPSLTTEAATEVH